MDAAGDTLYHKLERKNTPKHRKIVPRALDRLPTWYGLGELPLDIDGWLCMLAGEQARGLLSVCVSLLFLLTTWGPRGGSSRYPSACRKKLRPARCLPGCHSPKQRTRQRRQHPVPGRGQRASGRVGGGGMRQDCKSRGAATSKSLPRARRRLLLRRPHVPGARTRARPKKSCGRHILPARSLRVSHSV